MLKSLDQSIAPTTADPAPDRRPARGAIASLCLCLLLSSLSTSSANVALPTLTSAFSAPFQQVQWVVIAYLLVVTTLTVGVGRLGDIVGRRRLLLFGIAVFTVASALSAIAPTLWLLICARAVQGVGAAIMMSLTMAFVGETVPKEKTGSAMGLLGTVSAVGTALGPSLGGILIAAAGWPAVFLVNVPLGIAAVFLACRFLPSGCVTTQAARPSFDGVGTLLLAGSVAAYALAMTMGRGDFGVVNASLLLAAFAGTGLFVLAETRVASPLVQWSAFGDRELGVGLAANLLVSTVMMATLVVGPFYLSLGLGLNAALVGAVMSVGPVVSSLSGVIAGRAVDRLGASAMVIAGLATMVAGAVGIAALPGLLGISGYVAALVVLTPGYQLFLAANNTAVMGDVPATQRGVVSGLLHLSRNLGFITGASLMGAVFAFATAATDITAAEPAAAAFGMKVTFSVAAVLLVVAVAIALGCRPPRRRRA